MIFAPELCMEAAEQPEQPGSGARAARGRRAAGQGCQERICGGHHG